MDLTKKRSSRYAQVFGVKGAASSGDGPSSERPIGRSTPVPGCSSKSVMRSASKVREARMKDDLCIATL